MRLTNDWFVDIVTKYGIVIVLIVVVALLLPSFFVKKIRDGHNSLLTTCTLDELSVGTIASFDGMSLVVTKSVFYTNIGQGTINLSKI